MISLSEKTALITGASRGIGAATAVLFAEVGCRVAIHYHKDEGAAKSIQAECEARGSTAACFQADVADREAVFGMIRQVIDRFGTIDILVNNAGIWERAPIESMTAEELDRTLQINLNGVFHCCNAVAPAMIDNQNGSIINVASTAGQRGEAFHSHYAASKGGIISLTKSLAVELALHSIRVNCVAPGWVETDMSRASLESEQKEQILSQIPLRRAGTPQEIAGPILFLASELAAFITGEVLNVNGGAVLCG
jgi:3-oxoacyl-[acyl-carrier protein] reductase